MVKKALPSQYKIDIDIYKENGEHDKGKISKIDPKVIIFSYENGTSLMKEIDDDIKTIGARSTWLLGLLAIIFLAFSGFLFQDFGIPYYEQKGQLFWVLKSVAIILLSCALIYLLPFAKSLIDPNFGVPIHNEPRNILQASHFDINLVMIFEIEGLQDRINFNLGRLKVLTRNFNKLTGFVILSLPSAFILAIILWHFSKAPF